MHSRIALLFNLCPKRPLFIKKEERSAVPCKSFVNSVFDETEFLFNFNLS